MIDLRGHLNRFRRNLDSLDESIESLRKAPTGEKPADKRARLKLLRDLIELQESTLTDVKADLLGRSESGSVIEPEDYYDSNAQIEYERYFRNQLEPWTVDDLKLTCADCGSMQQVLREANLRRSRIRRTRRQADK